MTIDDQMGPQIDSAHYHLGSYRLIRSLGYGSFAFVYLGEHVYLKRLAAIKVLRTVLAEKEMGHFLEEARLLANLSHPHIVRVLEFAVAKRQVMQGSNAKEHIPFLVMDYAPNGNLRSFYPPGTRLALDKVINIVKQVAGALQYAHECNIIHRDIKPENLLLNEQQQIMLSDFGLALFAPSLELLSHQGMAGTLAYTAPEQLQGKPSFASDQYSLGIMTYEWLCGSRPFDGEDVEIIMQHISSPPPRLQGKNPLISRRVEDVVQKALAKDPRERYGSVQAFVEALEQASQVQALRPVTMPMRAVVPLQAPAPGKRDFPAFHYFAQKATIEPMDQHESTILIGQQEEASILADQDDSGSVYMLDSKQTAVISSSISRNRLRMIQKVRAFWVYGVLKQSLRGASFITLGLDERRDVVASTWSSMQQPAEGLAQSLAPGTTITEIYDQAGGELLILGEGGSGKTTLLLELARNLLDRAEQDETAPIPVVLLLSSWAEKQLPLEEWIVEELNNKYQVPRLLGEQWLDNEMLLPLLDGLDEVAANVRSACVVVINTYKEKRGLSPLVVCSRLTEYLLFPPRVFLRSAVVVRPLTMQQIEGYLRARIGGNFEILSQIVSNDLVLQQLVMKPLMLNIVALSCQGKSPEEIIEMCQPEGRYQRIFRIYVEQMLHRYQTTKSSSSQQLTSRLSYLAMQMQRRSQTVFYLEQLQPDWIENIQWARFYRTFAVLLPGALIGALAGILSNVLFFHVGAIGFVAMDALYGTVMGYLFSGRRADEVLVEEQLVLPEKSEKAVFKGDRLRMVFFVGLVTFLCMESANGWAVGLVNGLFLGVLSIPLSIFFQRSYKKKPRITVGQDTQPKVLFFPFEHFKNGLCIGVVCGLTTIVTMLISLHISDSTLPFVLKLGIRDSLRYTMLGMLLSALLTNNDGLIHRAEVVSWSWKIFRQSLRSVRNIVYDVFAGLTFGLVLAGRDTVQENMGGMVRTGLTTGIMIVIAARLMYAALRAVSSRNIDNHYRARPNEGIKRSLSHGLIGGAIGLVVVIFLSIITNVVDFLGSYGLAGLQQSSLLLASVKLGFSNALLLAPVGGLLVGLLLGGLAFLQYSILRFILWRIGKMPRDLFHLLEDAAACILLHKAGGGYLFAHRFLLEYFTSLHDDSAQLKTQVSPNAEPLATVLDKHALGK